MSQSENSNSTDTDYTRVDKKTKNTFDAEEETFKRRANLLVKSFSDFLIKAGKSLPEGTSFKDSPEVLDDLKKKMDDEMIELQEDYKSIDEIVNITDVEIKEAVIQVASRYGLAVEHAAILYSLIMTNELSIIKTVIRAAQAYKCEEIHKSDGDPFKSRFFLKSDAKEFIRNDYPEMSVTYKDGRNHEHPVPALTRAIDTRRINKKTGYQNAVLDVGGNPIAYLTKGISNRHCCSPKIDFSDAHRWSKRDDMAKVELVKMRKQLRNLEESNTRHSLRFDSDYVKIVERIRLYQDFLDNPNKYYCEGKAHECNFKATQAINIHAGYDIPISDWPLIMLAHQTTVVFGVMHYSDDVLLNKSGVWPEMGISYDREGDEIHFSFTGTLTPLYSHKYSEFVRYGHDCAIIANNAYFLYKVTKRRSYTVEFEIRLLSEDASSIRPMLNEIVVPSPKKDLVRLRSVEYDGWSDPKKNSSYVDVETYIDVHAWKRLLDYTMSAAESLTFDDVLCYTRSLMQHIVINRVVISDGKRITSDNFSTVAMCAFFITIKERYLSEDQIKYFRRGVDNRRKAKRNFVSFFTGRIIFDWVCDLVTENITDPISVWKSSLNKSVQDEANALPEFLEMFDYEEIPWEETVVEDYEISEQDIKNHIVNSEYRRRLYFENNVLLPKDFETTYEHLDPIEKAFLEAREMAIRDGDEEALAEVASLALAYYNNLAIVRQNDIDKKKEAKQYEEEEKKNRQDKKDVESQEVVSDENSDKPAEDEEQKDHVSINGNTDSAYDTSEPSFTCPDPSVDNSEVPDRSVSTEMPDEEILLEVYEENEPSPEIRKATHKMNEDMLDVKKKERLLPEVPIVTKNSLNLLAGKPIIPKLVVEDFEPIQEYLGNSHDIVEAEERYEREKIGRLQPIENTDLLFQKGEYIDRVSRKQYSRDAIKEYAELCASQEERARDLAINHIYHFVTFVPSKSRVGAHHPVVNSDTVALYGHQYEPDILLFTNGVLKGRYVKYAELQMFNVKQEWMLGIDVTTLEVAKGVPRFYEIRKRIMANGESQIEIDRDHRRDVKIYVEKDLSIVLGRMLAASLRRYVEDTHNIHVPKDMFLMEMPAGAGKTFFIVMNVKKGDIVLSDRRDTIGDIVKGIMNRGLSVTDVLVATQSSFIINSSQQCDVLHIDEGNMMHAGAIEAVIQIARPRVVIVYGDRRQISYVIRFTSDEVHYKLLPDHYDRYYTNISFRFTADAAYLNSRFYGRQVFTVNQRMRSFNVVEMGEHNLSKVPMDPEGHYICFTNQDVSELRTYFKNQKFSSYSYETIPAVKRVGKKQELTTAERRMEHVTTAHVAEGGTYKNVYIVRPTKVNFVTYSDVQHILVATTRHTNKCEYYSATPGDFLWSLMVEAMNVSDLELKTFIKQKPKNLAMRTKKGIKYSPHFDNHPATLRLNGGKRSD